MRPGGIPPGGTWRALLPHDPPREADAFDRDAPVLFAAQVIEPDLRVVRGFWRADAHPAARARPQVAHARRNRREAVQRVAELVERERLHVPFDVRGRLRWVTLRKGAQLRRRHGERPGLQHEIFGRHGGLADPAVGDAIQGLRVLHLVLQPDLEMVLQVLADAFQLVDHRHAQRLEMDAIADTRELQQLWRADRAGGEQGLALRFDVERFAAACELDALDRLARHA